MALLFVGNVGAGLEDRGSNHLLSVRLVSDLGPAVPHRVVVGIRKKTNLYVLSNLGENET